MCAFSSVPCSFLSVCPCPAPVGSARAAGPARAAGGERAGGARGSARCGLSLRSLCAGGRKLAQAPSDGHLALTSPFVDAPLPFPSPRLGLRGCRGPATPLVEICADRQLDGNFLINIFSHQ